MNKKGIKKIWLPLLVVAFAGFRLFGTDAGRGVPVRRTADSLESLLSADSSAAVLKDSVIPAGADSLGLAEDSLRTSLSDSIVSKADSVVAPSDSLDTPPDSAEQLLINPADTIRIPDSLEFKDPFKFKYYIALRDSATRAYTRDTLIAAGDTLELARLDSL